MKKINEEQFFDEFIDANFNKVKLFNKYEYQSSKVLKLIDPVMYRTILLDYIDFMKKEGHITEINEELYFTDSN